MARQKRSGRWMAEQIHQPHNTVARWLAGESNPGADHMDAMCRALGFRLADLVVAVQCQDEERRGKAQRRATDRLGLIAFAALL